MSLLIPDLRFCICDWRLVTTRAKLRCSVSPCAGEIEFGTELVQDRLFQSGNDRFLRTEQVEDHDFIQAGFQPGTRQIHGLLRADIPETSQVMAVHPNETFAPSAQVEEGVASLG